MCHQDKREEVTVFLVAAAQTRSTAHVMEKCSESMFHTNLVMHNLYIYYIKYLINLVTRQKEWQTFQRLGNQSARNSLRFEVQGWLLLKVTGHDCKSLCLSYLMFTDWINNPVIIKHDQEYKIFFLFFCPVKGKKIRTSKTKCSVRFLTLKGII